MTAMNSRAHSGFHRVHTTFTNTQVETCEFWASFEQAHGFPPTMREAAAFFGLSVGNTIGFRCYGLIAKGAMSRASQATGHRGAARATLLTDLGRRLANSVAAIARIVPVVSEKKCPDPCGLSHFRIGSELCNHCELVAMRADAAPGAAR